LEHHHRTQNLARVHLVERVLDVVEADAFGHELLQRQPALQVEADQRGEVAFGKAIAVPGRLQCPTAGEEVDQRHLQLHVRCRNTHQHNGSGEIAGVERLLPGLRSPDRVDHDVGTVAVGEVLDGLHRIEFLGVYRVRRAETAGQVQLLVVGVDGDYPLGADKLRPGNGGITDAAATDHGDGVVAVHRAGVDRRSDTRHHSAA